MWLSPVAWLSAVPALVHAAGRQGVLCLYEAPGATPSLAHHASISADTARLILASRLGVDRHHQLGPVDAPAMEAINRFGRSEIFLAASVPAASAVAVVLAQEEHGLDKAFTHKIPLFSSPPIDQTEELFSALAIQKTGWKDRTLLQTTEALRSGEAIHAADLSASVHVAKSSADLQSLLTSLRQTNTSVLVFISPTDTSSTARYGPYSLPIPAFSKRAASGDAEVMMSTSAANSSSSTAKRPKWNSSFGSPLLGILPRCFHSLSSCQSRTRNCTGHGTCSLAFIDHDSEGDTTGGVPCYSCSCTPSIRRNLDGSTKTTVWGGPACQKKNIVAPFWLLAGFTIVMVTLVGFGAGSIWSMGEEQLPSVIGAGVSGAPRK